MMLLVQSALRAMALALAVWAGLRVFRIRNVLAEKGAWTMVLAAALVMPLLLPISARWPAATVVLPAVVARASASPLTALPTSPEEKAIPEAGPQTGSAYAGAVPETARPAASAAPGLADRFPAPAISNQDLGTAPGLATAPPAHRTLTPAAWIAMLYFAVTGFLLLRLLFGISAALRIWRAAEPVSWSRVGCDLGLKVRSSRLVPSPITIGSGVVLPASYAGWGEEKLRIVLAHERSHIRQGDFYLQTLASLYAAVVWFSPLGWWMKRKLSDLGEAISDRSGLEEAASRSSYAEMLLEFAAAPRPAMMGVAMARQSSLSRRIERLLNDNAFRQAFAGGRRGLVAALLVPLALLAATALVRVQAASQAPAAAHPSQSQASPAPPAVAVAPEAVPAAPASAPAPMAPVAAAQNPQPPGAPAGKIDIPAIHIDVPAVHVSVPAVHVNVPAVHLDVPGQHIDVPAIHVNVPAQDIHVPAKDVNVPAQHIDVPAQHIEIPAIHVDVSKIGNQSAMRIGPTGDLLAMLSGGEGLLREPEPTEAEATFDRTLSFSGKTDLHVMNGSGNIHLTRGSAGQVRIHARVHSNRAEDAAEVREIAAHPPIEQDGNTIRIGGEHRENMRHISIDYDIVAPADTGLQAASGSGNVTDEGVGQEASLTTGSGNVIARGLQGGFKAETGSGNVTIETAGSGDARAETGSGNIHVNGVDGALLAQTGSGSIDASGKPTSAWKLSTGSGSVQFSPGTAAVTIDASTGSGSISSNQEMEMQVSANRHHLHGTLHGGGPLVRIETGSGSIQIR